MNFNLTFKRIILFLLTLACPATAMAQTTHTVYYEGSTHELDVYRIYGKTPGKTVMLIGGIQGDEPGGFLSADIYADIALEKGNLIVVPRANFQSIVMNKRQINEDMNRKFADDRVENYEAKVVTVLKQLICESDCLLNLHDGSGFFSEKWENDQRNPKKFGQSIIADSETFQNPTTGKIVNMGDMARAVIRKTNLRIADPDLKFHFNNHKTSRKDSLHREQRRSATFFAMSKCHVPAFGIESSKSLSLETKVRHHVFAINAFLELMDVVPEVPGVHLDVPRMEYLLVSVNDSLPLAVNNGSTLYLTPGDRIKILTIEANYPRGLSADILGAGDMDDLGNSVSIEKPSRIMVRKDSYPCGSVYLALGGAQTPLASAHGVDSQVLLLYKVRINGELIVAENYQHLEILKGDILTIEDVVFTGGDSSALEVNLKGFVGDRSNNTGEDRGVPVDTAKDLMKRFSMDKKGMSYQVIVKDNNIIVGKLFFDMKNPVLRYLILKKDGGPSVAYGPGETIVSVPEDGLRLMDAVTNLGNQEELSFCLAWPGGTCKLKRGELIYSASLTEGRPMPCRVEVRRGSVIMGAVLINVTRENSRG